jgi:hypothetical protein
MRRALARNTNSIGGVDQNLKDELSRVFVVGQTHGCNGRPQIITHTCDRVPLQDPFHTLSVAEWDLKHLWVLVRGQELVALSLALLVHFVTHVKHPVPGRAAGVGGPDKVCWRRSAGR